MGRPKNLWRGAALLELVVIVLMLLWLFPEPPVDQSAAQKNFAGIVLSRKGIDDVRKFKDDTYMHGQSYYYFQADSQAINRLISLLELQKAEKIPAEQTSLVGNAVSRNGWQFSWATSQVYLAYYCNPDEADGLNFNVDMLLVGNGAGIFVTRGYLPPTITRTTDTSKCEPPRFMSQPGR